MTYTVPSNDSTWQAVQSALTKRELFAAMVLQGILANPYRVGEGSLVMAVDAVIYADALIAELNKKPPK